MSREHRERMFAEGGNPLHKGEYKGNGLSDIFKDEENKVRKDEYHASKLMREMLKRAKPRMKDHE